MTMGRYLGMNREASARFSFLLSLPIIAAAGVFKGKELLGESEMQVSMGVLVAGFLSATIVGLIAIHLLLALLRSADFAIFAWYRLGLAGFIVIWSLFFGG